ncbi:CLUMA_CG013260, isoform A [Clunio marinus]|uniref:CLUMA_CG013260, isoform A n=1 Tax=Clunio marinus TaxID=568069 RepID=A0A1J1II86_9DIPT|nr:CLUMA_CG013260, isoform A [Clunio marinus]
MIPKELLEKIVSISLQVGVTHFRHNLKVSMKLFTTSGKRLDYENNLIYNEMGRSSFLRVIRSQQRLNFSLENAICEAFFLYDRNREI